MSKVITIAINGLGRIGRCFIRSWLMLPQPQAEQIRIVAINDIEPADILVHLLQYDSTHGRLNVPVTLHNNQGQWELHANGQRIPFYQIANPVDLPWARLEVDLVLECTGVFRRYSDALKHQQAGAKRVLIGAAPFDTVDIAVVYGVNHQHITDAHTVLSSVSCTTQALVPLVQILEQAFGIQHALMTEIHAMTADQCVLDHAHRDWRRARSAAHNIIPTTSSALAALCTVLPQMQGKIDGYSIRIPTQNVAAIDLSFTTHSPVPLTAEAINQALSSASQQQYHAIMAMSTLPLVSSDFVGRAESLIVDSQQTMVIGMLNKVFVWYDNEWAYAKRLCDLVLFLANRAH